MDNVEYKFPDEKEQPASKEAEDKIEFEVVDDTPDEDKGRKPLAEPVNEPTDEELAKYDEGVQRRIKKLSHGYHDERKVSFLLSFFPPSLPKKSAPTTPLLSDELSHPRRVGNFHSRPVVLQITI